MVRMRTVLVLGAVAVGVAATIAALVGGGVLGRGVAPGGERVYTDGMALRVPEREAALRTVVWDEATPVVGGVGASADEYEPRVGAGGTRLVFVRGRAGGGADLFEREWMPGGWGEARSIDGLNTAADELGPELTRDGRTLYFYSDRQGGVGGYDLWVAGREGDSWGVPRNLGAGVNTAYDEYGPAVDEDAGVIYFASNRVREGEPIDTQSGWPATMRERRARHDYDLYRAALGAGGAVLAGGAESIDAINTEWDEGAPAITPAGDFLCFASDRPGGMGGFDLWRARMRHGEPGAAENIGARVNTPANELDPTHASEGFRLVFSSDRLLPGASSGAGGGADPGYALWTSLSREVFLERVEARAAWLSLLGELWPWLLLLLLLLALLWLLAKLARDPRFARRLGQLSLLAKCLLVSLLVHAVLASLLAAWRVSVAVEEFLREGGGVRVAIMSGAGEGIAGQVRGGAGEIELPRGPELDAMAMLPREISTRGLAEIETSESVRAPSDAEEPLELSAPELAATHRQMDGAEPAAPAPMPVRDERLPEVGAVVVDGATANPAMPRAIGELSATPGASGETPATELDAGVAFTALALSGGVSGWVPVSVPGEERREALAEPAREETREALVREVNASSAVMTREANGAGGERGALPRAGGGEGAPEFVARDVGLARVAPGAMPEVAVPGVEFAVRSPENVELADDIGAARVDGVDAIGIRSSMRAGEAVRSSGGAAAKIDIAGDVEPRALAPAPRSGVGGERVPGVVEAPAPVETFAQRDPEVRAEVLEEGGGSEETERSVGLALEWLARHQEESGCWSGERFDDGCGRCGSGSAAPMDVSMTGLALLCYLGAGHTHTEEGPYRDNVARALRWLLARQQPDGDLRGSETMYAQTIASVALCEAYAMTSDAALAGPARAAVGLVLAGSGEGRGESASVLGWLVMAEESARRAGIDVPRGASRAAGRWLDRVEVRSGRYAYSEGESPSPAMTAEAMFVRQLLGSSRGGAGMDDAARFILTKPPVWEDGAPTYYWYYATLALFQHQGPTWEAWNVALATELIEHQRHDGPAAGSWDPHDRWSMVGGRIYQTAICTLSLEVYYRYRPAGMALPGGGDRRGGLPSR